MSKDNLHLTLSTNLTLSVITTAHLDSDCSQEDWCIELIKEEYKKVGEHRLLRKAVISLSPTEYQQFLPSTSSVDSFLKFVSTNHVKSTSPEIDERSQHTSSKNSQTI